MHAINVNDIKISNSSVVIPIREILKHSTQRQHKHVLYLQPYPTPAVCVVSTLRANVNRTNLLRGSHAQLFMSFTRPYAPVSEDTICRWIKRVMFEAGIDTEIFKSHSTRAAAASAEKRDNVPLEHILTVAGWTNSKTFEKFCDTVII